MTVKQPDIDIAFKQKATTSIEKSERGIAILILKNDETSDCPSYAEYKEITEFDGIVIDESAHVVTIDGQNADLSMKEFELLQYLISNKGVALSREKILNNVWNYDYYGDSRTIDSHIKKIRHKLGKKGKYIKTMRGVGYKFEVK